MSDKFDVLNKIERSYLFGTAGNYRQRLQKNINIIRDEFRKLEFSLNRKNQIIQCISKLAGLEGVNAKEMIRIATKKGPFELYNTKTGVSLKHFESFPKAFARWEHEYGYYSQIIIREMRRKT